MARQPVSPKVESSADRQPRRPVPAFEHVAFPVGLGFVAGFVDIFSFTALLGLLPAHVTGNLIFLAIDLARHESSVVMKVAALPIFAASVAISAWLIGRLSESGRHPFLPMMLLQAAALGLSLIAGLILPKPATPDDTTVIAVGTMMLFAMALQNTVMRLILNNLPPTTIMTGNITHMVAEGVRWLAGFGATMTQADKASLAYRAGASAWRWPRSQLGRSPVGWRRRMPTTWHSSSPSQSYWRCCPSIGPNCAPPHNSKPRAVLSTARCNTPSKFARPMPSGPPGCQGGPI
jgi:uncharacterized membrane protein YoaK (UPF0700 family)